MDWTHDNVPQTLQELRDKNPVRLNAEELDRRIRGRCYVGLYRRPFDYIVCFGAEGTMQGKNNFGTQDAGVWSIDKDTGELSVKWQQYWDANTAKAYSVGNSIHLFDSETRLWRTTLQHEVDANALLNAVNQ